MSPAWLSGRRAPLSGAATVLCLWSAAPSPAWAVVGGEPSTGPLSRGTVMVLSSKGGVCSGVVVAPDAVLTAAHCASGAPQHRVHWKGAAGEPVLVEPAEIALHPGYDSGAVAGRRRSVDLALMRLPSPVPDRFAPATLDGAAATAGETVLLAGYGVDREGDGRSTGTFRQVALPVVEPYGPSRILVWLRGRPGTGACQGDSGGPIARGEAVFAVTNWAAGAGRRGCGDTSQGALVGPQRAWIDATLRRWSRQALWR